MKEKKYILELSEDEYNIIYNVLCEKKRALFKDKHRTNINYIEALGKIEVLCKKLEQIHGSNNA